MNWKAWTPLILAAILGLLAAKTGRDIVLRAQHAGVDAGKFTKIVAAKSDLEPGHALAESDLTLVAVQSDSLPRSAFRQTGQIVGRVLVVPIIKGQTILETSLAPRGTQAGPQALVPAGMRAVTVDVTESSGLGGLLTPQCHVDVVSTLQDETAGQQIARTIVENALVLAVGQRLTSPSLFKADESIRPKTVTLLVSPRDAEAIELACNVGRTRLVLRGALDQGSANTSGVTVAELLGGRRQEPQVVAQVSSPSTQPALPPPPVVAEPKIVPFRPVEVIRNGVVSQVEVPIRPKPLQNAVTGGNAEIQPVFPGGSH